MHLKLNNTVQCTLYWNRACLTKRRRGWCVMHGLVMLVCGSVSFKIVLARAMLIADCIELSSGDHEIIRMKSITHGFMSKRRAHKIRKRAISVESRAQSGIAVGIDACCSVACMPEWFMIIISPSRSNRIKNHVL